MARGHGRILTSVWEDSDFLALTQEQQRLYLFLISQPNLNHAGLLPLTLRRWTRKAAGLSFAELDKHLAALDEARFIVVDDDTEELLVRSFVRNDGVWKQPKVMGAMVSGAMEISSWHLRRALLAEMDRVPLEDLSDEPAKLRSGEGPSIRQQVSDHIEALRRAFREPEGTPPARASEAPSATPCGSPSATPCDSHADGPAEPSTRGRAGAQTRAAPAPAPAPAPIPCPIEDVVAPVVDIRPAPLDRTVEPVRLDVEQACTLLADLIEANGSRKPVITQDWRDECRRMIDRDRVPLENVLAAIRWSQADSFWCSNVLSMPKLRKQYDTLRLQAQRGHSSPLAATGTDGRQLSTADRRVQDAAQLAARLAAEENQ
ncbi:hypothetical protein [Kitasatospora mediocidica]|uniref:hypothetical protein n=1 Tax=Kitasatospora mediocidica TaxID=58352 RepID=UPI00068B38C8|nr:hypothetical protein [Kitasatospora mediocidica]